MNYNTRGEAAGGSKILTTMRDFIILTKIGKLSQVIIHSLPHNCTFELISFQFDHN